MDLMWQVEGIVKQLTAAGDHDRISAVINLLTNKYTYSPQANYLCFNNLVPQFMWCCWNLSVWNVNCFLQGGLIGLAAATVGLTSEASQHLEVGGQTFTSSVLFT